MAPTSTFWCGSTAAQNNAGAWLGQQTHQISACQNARNPGMPLSHNSTTFPLCCSFPICSNAVHRHQIAECTSIRETRLHRNEHCWQCRHMIASSHRNHAMQTQWSNRALAVIAVRTMPFLSITQFDRCIPLVLWSMQCLELMQQSGLSAIAITDSSEANQLIGNFSVSDLRYLSSVLHSRVYTELRPPDRCPKLLFAQYQIAKYVQPAKLAGKADSSPGRHYYVQSRFIMLHSICLLCGNCSCPRHMQDTKLLSLYQYLPWTCM